MNLEQLLVELEVFPDDHCIFARKPWGPASEALAAPLEQNFQVPVNFKAIGLEYFLEVDVAREVLEVISDRPANLEEQLKLLIFYADNDAYPDWIYGS